MVLECVKADVAVADGLLDIVAIPPVVLAAVVVENASSAQGKEDTMKLNIDNYCRIYRLFEFWRCNKNYNLVLL